VQQAKQRLLCLAYEKVTISALLLAELTQSPWHCGQKPSRAVAQNRGGRADGAGRTIKMLLKEQEGLVCHQKGRDNPDNSKTTKRSVIPLIIEWKA